MDASVDMKLHASTGIYLMDLEGQNDDSVSVGYNGEAGKQIRQSVGPVTIYMPHSVAKMIAAFVVGEQGLRGVD